MINEMEEKKYYQINLVSQKHVVISETAKVEENTKSVKQALSHIAAGNIVYLDGLTYDIKNYNRLIKNAAKLCPMNERELMEYAVDLFK